MVRRPAKYVYGNPPITKTGWILGWWIATDPVTKAQTQRFTWEDADGSITVEEVEYDDNNNNWSFTDSAPAVIPIIE